MEDKKYLFQKLTPVNNADISVYEEAVNFVFENEDILNVAISGAYSAGKSSVLESYKEKNKGIKFVHISLAHFQTQDQKDIDINESFLEGKIINQLIHQISAERIPKTNFRVKKEVSKESLQWWTILISIFIGSILFLVFNNRIMSFITGLSDSLIKKMLSIFFNQYTCIPVLLVCGSCSIYFLFALLKTQNNRNIFRKLNFQGNEIEIFEEQNDSFFDKYLNEVLYLFERIEADVIVFEDMDRFNDNNIFERLREINALANINRKKLGENKTLRFFYLLRDDIFVSKDRTKFFEFIIPIIPVVDSSNSYDQFLKHLQEGNMAGKFDNSFLQRLSLYVDDMRILKNVYNEFTIYIYRLNTTDLDWNKMMALIVYKNIFPRDFCDLQLARGYVYEVFERKQALISESLNKLDEKRKKLSQRIEMAKNEILVSIQELEDAYSAKAERLPKNNYYNHSFTLDGEKQNQQYLIEKEEREQAIQDKLNDKILDIEADLTAIEKEIIKTRTKLLKEIITRNNIDEVFMVTHKNAINHVNEFNEIKSSNYFDLLKFLIRNGYIDETYNDYMTYFYEDSLSANDKTFLRQIADKRGANYLYMLKDAKKIIDSPVIRIVDFEEEETLNFDLLLCLIINRNIQKYREYLTTLILQLKEKKCVDFISRYYDSEKYNDQFIVKLNEQWADFFSYISHEKLMPILQIRRYSLDTIRLSIEDIIELVNVENCLSDYISGCNDYLSIEEKDIKKIISAFKRIDVKFTSINYEVSNKELFQKVYQNSLYVISFENLVLMIEKEYGINNKDDICNKNYTIIQTNGESPLAKYVIENMTKYIDIVIENCNGKITDDESVVIQILNNKSMEIDLKQRYIKCLTTIVSDIDSIDDFELWKLLLNENKVLFSNINFVKYYQKFGVDEVLIDYVNKETDRIDFNTTENVFGNEVARKLFNSIVICNNIENEKYEIILNDLGYLFNGYSDDEIEDDKISILITNKILKMDVDALLYIRNKHQKHTMKFININLEEYLNIQESNIFNIEEALQIIEWDVIDNKKINLLSLTSKSISVTRRRYSDDVLAYIISHNRDEDDDNYLYLNYSKFGKNTKAEIVKLAIDQVDNIIRNEMIIEDILLSTLLTCEHINQINKIQLFAISIPSLNEDTCKNHFDELGLSELKGIFTKRNVNRNYEKNNSVRSIFEALKLNTWIYEYREDENNTDKYIVTKNKPKFRSSDF